MPGDGGRYRNEVPSTMEAKKDPKLRAVACCGIVVSVSSLLIVRCLPSQQFGNEWELITFVLFCCLMEQIATVFDPTHGTRYTWALQLSFLPLALITTLPSKQANFHWLNLCILIPIVAFGIFRWLRSRAEQLTPKSLT